MAVTIRNMTAAEFERVYCWSAMRHVTELMEELHIPEEDAMNQASQALHQMLPSGINTPHNHLLTIAEESSDESAGFIWLICEEFEGRKQCFICDFAIWEGRRRQGYGASALFLAEKYAAKAGCRESVLFVRDENAPARSLYEKSGYRVLRQHSYGKFMIKQIF